MTTPQELKAQERDTTLTPRQLRAAGFVPATLYGKGIESQSIQVRAHEFVQLSLQGHREFSLSGYGSNLVVRTQQMQVDPVSRQPISIEFYQLSPQAGAQPKAKKQAAEKPVTAEKPVEEAAPEAETVLTGA